VEAVPYPCWVYDGVATEVLGYWALEYAEFVPYCEYCAEEGYGADVDVEAVE
jgi:hypothetical protein